MVRISLDASRRHMPRRVVTIVVPGRFDPRDGDVRAWRRRWTAGRARGWRRWMNARRLKSAGTALA